ncbi:DUF58 domain-containing protein [Lysobacter korlensis]|uniref:DUF58 domain-containing protein n=1 Tax=Lysobacter korlensis TaxID=553636 RepID=A0ABV6RZT3_9GAMM
MSSPDRSRRSPQQAGQPRSRTVLTRSRTGVAGGTRTSATSRRSELDAHTAIEGLTNARTRIVGTRTGFLADLVVGVVRLFTSVRGGVAAVFRAVSTVVTPLGWTVLAVTPLCFLAGYGLGWTELVVVAWTLTALLVAAGVYLLGRTSLQVDLELPRSRVVVGQPAAARIRVSNPSARRSFGMGVEVPVDEGLAALAVPGIPAGGAHEAEFGVPTARRGVLALGPARTVRADPVGMVRRELELTETTELFVHPRTIAIPSASLGVVRDLEGTPTRDLTSSDVSFHSLREYVPGDERRHIHWRSTAKTGTYMVRQFEETRRSHLVVGLSLATADYASEEEFELAVSVAASLGIRAIRDGRSLSVVVGERTPAFAKRKVFEVRSLSTLSRSRLLDDFAGLQREESSLHIPDVARVTAAKVPAISVAMLVCGSGATAAQLRGAANQFPLGVEVTAVVCDATAVPGYKRLAGLTVFTVGYLEDLAKALARSAAA